jgi:hypothetical protein
VITLRKPTAGQVKRGTIMALGIAAFCAVGGMPLLALAAFYATIGLVLTDKEREVAEQRERENRATWNAAKDGLLQHGFNPEAYL